MYIYIYIYTYMNIYLYVRWNLERVAWSTRIKMPICIYIYICIYTYTYIFIHVGNEKRSRDLLVSKCLYSVRSQGALNIRLAPGKSWFLVGPYDWWEYNYNILNHSSHSWNLFSHTSNTKACAIQALKTCRICCLHLLPLRPACHFPSFKGIKQNTTKSVPTDVLILIWSYSFDSIWYGSQNQVFDAFQWGKMAGKTERW